MKLNVKLNKDMYKDENNLQKKIYSVLDSNNIFPRRGSYEPVNVEYD